MHLATQDAHLLNYLNIISHRNDNSKSNFVSNLLGKYYKLKRRPVSRLVSFVGTVCSNTAIFVRIVVYSARKHFLE